MISFLIVLHIIICILLIAAVLMQSSKGGGMAGMFGGGGSMGGVFGGRGAASFLSKVSLWLGVCFGITSLAIGLLSLRAGGRPKSLIQQTMERERTATSPASALPTIPSKAGNPTDLVPKGAAEKPVKK